MSPDGEVVEVARHRPHRDVADGDVETAHRRGLVRQDAGLDGAGGLHLVLDRRDFPLVREGLPGGHGPEHEHEDAESDTLDVDRPRKDTQPNQVVVDAERDEDEQADGERAAVRVVTPPPDDVREDDRERKEDGDAGRRGRRPGPGRQVVSRQHQGHDDPRLPESPDRRLQAGPAQLLQEDKPRYRQPVTDAHVDEGLPGHRDVDQRGEERGRDQETQAVEDSEQPEREQGHAARRPVAGGQEDGRRTQGEQDKAESEVRQFHGTIL